MIPSEPIPFRRLFPWLHLVRAFGIAVSPRQILLSGLALLVLSLGKQLADVVLPCESSARPFRGGTETVAESDKTRKGAEGASSSTSVADSASMASLNSISTWNWRNWTAPLCWLAPPWFSVVTSASQACTGTTECRGRVAFDSIWGLAVWSAFGLAICRLAAIRFAREEAGSLRQATRFGITRWRRAFSAPLIPLAATMMMMLPALMLMWPGGLPVVGTTWLVLVSPALLSCGFLIGVLLLAAAVGWPLMIAAIAVDDCDGFGGLSRSYSLWTGAFLYAAWCMAVALGLGVASHSLVSLALNGTRAITLNIATLVLGNDAALEYLATSCTTLVRGLRDSFAISLYWTNTTIIYLLLRRCIDKLPLDQIAPNDGERPPHDPLPVVGMPAMADVPSPE